MASAPSPLTLAIPTSRTASAPLHLLTGFFLAFRLSITYLAFQSDPRTGTTVILILGIALFSAAIVYTLGNTHPIPHNNTLRWLAAYMTLTGASLLWTGAASPAIAAGYWAAMLMDIATVALLLKSTSPTAHTEALLKGFVVGSLLVAAIAWLAPTLPDLRIGDDEFLHPNNLGLEFALAFFFAQHLAIRSPLWRWPLIALGISLLRTISKTSILAFLIAEAIYLLRDTHLSRWARIRIASIGVLALGVFAFLSESYFSDYVTDGNSAETLTGRTTIWLASWLIAIERPWFGHGIYSYRALIPAFGKLEPYHAHNELLQQFFEIGLLGVIITIALHVSLYRTARRTPQLPFAALAMTLVLFCAIRGLADTINFGLSLPIWLFAALAIANTSREVPA